MERAIIKDKNDTILLYLNEDNSFSGFRYYAYGRVEPIDYSVFKYFDMLKLSKNYIVLSSINGYLIVLDNDTNFKHFFKNGVEDYAMFFYNNGETALEFMSKDGKIPEWKKRLSKIFKTGAICVLVSAEILYASMLLPRIIRENNHDVITEDLTVRDVFSMIDNCTNLPSGVKKLFKQREFFELFLPYFNSNPLARDNLLDVFDNTKINSLTAEEIMLQSGGCDWSNVIAFCNKSIPNEINVKLDLELIERIDSLSHELIHLLECPGLEYSALREAMAEQLSFEFFPLATEISFHKEVLQLRNLMDLIGAEPFVKYYTTGSMDLIENKMKPYLGDERYNAFVSTLTKVKILDNNNPEHNHSVYLEEERIKKLDSIISELALKMGIDLRNIDIDKLSADTKRYFNNSPMRISLLNGLMCNLKEVYDSGAIGFALKDEKGNICRSLNYYEAIEKYENPANGSEELVVTYNPDGESTWTWTDADITKENSEYMVEPFLINVDSKKFYRQFYNNTDGTLDRKPLINTVHSISMDYFDQYDPAPREDNLEEIKRR